MHMAALHGRHTNLYLRSIEIPADPPLRDREFRYLNVLEQYNIYSLKSATVY
jgi:hypothetical protein